MFALGEWYSCRGLPLVANSGVSTLGFNMQSGCFPHQIRMNYIATGMAIMAHINFQVAIAAADAMQQRVQ